VVKHARQDMTLPVCIFEKRLLPIDVEEGEKTHTEKVNAYKSDFFVMTSAYNDEKRNQDGTWIGKS
jgi:hypothetical protein